MRYIFAILRVIFSIYGFIVFFVFMFLFFPLAIIASFFGTVRGGNIIYKLCHIWADLALLFWGIFHKNIYETPHDKNKQYIFVFNHISFMDVPIILKAIRGQHFRVLGKAEMAKIPIFGFFYRNTVVLVDRSNAAERAKSVMRLKAIIRSGISVVLAPEGTFNTTGKPLKEFYNGAFKVAIETQTPIKPILFLDAYDRLNYKQILSLTPGRSRAVYLEEISVEGLTLKDMDKLKDKVYHLMEKKLIEYKASWIITS
ncbi:1-acyl-sn-glycerol-3-phosphate acyltransferase [Ferruginibacter lapsinanis]|uniref:lysophospholipid acyltransferase family protein n=1 Tax=Ferruginibacter lapsinanis TaxID=563172 RepID=UPI001E4904B3|nr:lysophospholipid acyltransferase family protein [Ferruginibacter lapsinanis]UEG49878.1 1-acyl-sn-glycerol-3-phosphate acyltransferase [Ferruginibacter lapsinanis]